MVSRHALPELQWCKFIKIEVASHFATGCVDGLISIIFCILLATTSRSGALELWWKNSHSPGWEKIALKEDLLRCEVLMYRDIVIPGRQKGAIQKHIPRNSHHTQTRRRVIDTAWLSTGYACKVPSAFSHIPSLSEFFLCVACSSSSDFLRLVFPNSEPGWLPDASLKWPPCISKTQGHVGLNRYCA